MTVKLNIEIQRDIVDESVFLASLIGDDEIIIGNGDNPYEALHQLIDELEYQHQYFRADSE